jgi:signal transduction histidine kinase
MRLNHGPPGGQVSRDPNPSIEPDHLRERTFKGFWRGETGREGTGLELAIVRRIMRLLRGDVPVSDAPGGGARCSLQPRSRFIGRSMNEDRPRSY